MYNLYIFIYNLYIFIYKLYILYNSKFLIGKYRILIYLSKKCTLKVLFTHIMFAGVFLG